MLIKKKNQCRITYMSAPMYNSSYKTKQEQLISTKDSLQTNMSRSASNPKPYDNPHISKSNYQVKESSRYQTQYKHADEKMEVSHQSFFLEPSTFLVMSDFILQPKERASKNIESIACSFFSYKQNAAKATGSPAIINGAQNHTYSN